MLLAAREEKASQAAAKAAKKAVQIEAENAKRIAKLEKGKTPPGEMFKPPNVDEGLYGSWNEEGIPLTDGKGEALPKSRGKKLAKEWEMQGKLHKEWLAYLKEQEEGKQI